MSVNLIDFFDRGVSLDPARPCLIDYSGPRSHRQVQSMSCRVANALMRDRIGPGAHVAVLSHNSARAFECVLGLIRAGCVWVPANVRNTVFETSYIINHTDVTTIFYAREFAGAIEEILEKCPRVGTVLCMDGPSLSGPSGFDEWLGNATDERPQSYVPGDAIATLFCSGGTTGAPKGVVVTHRIWAHRIAETLLRLRTERPVHLVVAPMTHAAGAIALEIMVLGATHVILPRFDPEAIIKAIDEHRVTHMFLPPTALYRLLAHPQVRNGDYSSLRYFTCSAAPISPEKLVEAAEIFGAVMCQAYGSTEMGSSVCWFPPEMHASVIASADRARLRSCGKPSLLARVAIVSGQGEVCKPGEQGEILVRSYSLASGYYHSPKESEMAFAGGWFHTGDIGFADEEGWIYVCDRNKDMIISGGFNIYPSEIERVLMSHSGVRDCAVIGVPDEDWGEAVKAVIEARPDAQLDLDELERLCRTTLAGYKVPKSFEVWAEIPRSPVGKVLKRVIREKFWAGRSRSI